MSAAGKTRHRELIEYMHALAKARREAADADCEVLDMQVERHEFMDALAGALGIDVSADDWWEGDRIEKQRKIFGRIEMLRGRAVIPKLPAFVCSCGQKILYGRRHLNCPAAEKQNA